MSEPEETALESLKEEFYDLLFHTAKDIVNSKKLLLPGMSCACNFLIISVDENHAIYLDLLDHDISLVDERDYSFEDYGTLKNITILGRFFIEFHKVVDEIDNHSLFVKLLDFFKNFFSVNSNTVNSAELLLRAEIWYHKSLLSFMIAANCHREDGKYYFRLPSGDILHVYINLVYGTDEGNYLLEVHTGKFIEFKDGANCKQELLNACKYLIDHPELLTSK